MYNNANERCIMLTVIKNIFGKKTYKNASTDAPGRTFNKVLTGKYFGCEDLDADPKRIAEAKQKKIDQIKELELKPKFTRYLYEDMVENHAVAKPISVQVTFQKEVSPEHHNMVHITEVSFIVNYEDLNEFEQMAGVSLFDDFRQLSSEEITASFEGIDRRNDNRNA